MRQIWLLSALLLSALLLTACGDPREKHMRRSLEHAQAALHRAQIEPLAAARLRNAMETATLIDYLDESRVEGSDLGPFRWQQAQSPYDVVVTGGVDDWKIEGYGATLDAPIVTVHAVRE